MDDGTRTGYALLLPAAHLIRILLEHIGDIQRLCHHFNVLEDGFGLFTHDGQRKRDVFIGRQRVQKVEILKHEAQFFPPEARKLRRAHSRYVFSAHQNLAGSRRINGRYAVQQRGFAAAGSTHDADKLTLLYREADVVQRTGGVASSPVDFIQRMDLEYFFHSVTASF